MPIQFRPRYKDPFSPVLLSDAPPVPVADERKSLIMDVLNVACSDSRFAQKAYAAITFILSAPKSVLPVVATLTPNSAELGDPSFTLHVHGTGFKSGDSIVFNGGIEPTVFVSSTELTTGVNMDTVSGPFTVPVMIQTADGSLSNSMDFSFTDGSAPVGLGSKSVSPKVPTTPTKEFKKQDILVDSEHTIGSSKEKK